jgi:hypothetical protein
MADKKLPTGTLVSFEDAVAFRRYLAGELDLSKYSKMESKRSDASFQFQPKAEFPSPSVNSDTGKKS